MGCRNPVGESPTSCALVLFERTVDEISGEMKCGTMSRFRTT